MNFPKKIYLQQEDGEHPECDNYFGQGMTWCEDKINKDDAEYVRADLVNHKLLQIAHQVCKNELDDREYIDNIGFEDDLELCQSILSRIKQLTKE